MLNLSNSLISATYLRVSHMSFFVFPHNRFARSLMRDLISTKIYRSKLLKSSPFLLRNLLYFVPGNLSFYTLLSGWNFIAFSLE